MLEIKMIEKTVKWQTNMEANPRDVPVGWVAIYTDELYNEKESEVIGTAYGVNHAIYKRESDNHLIQYVTEQFLLPDGSLVAEGPIDRQLVVTQQWVSIPVRGISGIYLGMAGMWNWRIISVTDPLIPLLSNITLGP